MAETLPFVDGAEKAYLMSKLLAEILHNKKKSYLTIECRTDNKSLFQAAHTLKTLKDRRLNVEIAIVRQMLEREEIELVWIKAKEQLADVLTKKGASSLTLLKALQEGLLVSKNKYASDSFCKYFFVVYMYIFLFVYCFIIYNVLLKKN